MNNSNHFFLLDEMEAEELAIKVAVHHALAEEQPSRYAEFVSQVLRQALLEEPDPERMDGGNVAADFHNRFAAEIRLPEALEEKLLCPFHYFGVADPVDISKDHFWKNGRYDDRAGKRSPCKICRNPCSYSQCIHSIEPSDDTGSCVVFKN